MQRIVERWRSAGGRKRQPRLDSRARIPVDREDLARDRADGGTREEQCELGDIVGFDEALHRLVSEGPAAFVFERRSLGLGPASENAVDALAGILGRVAASETSDYFRDLHREHGVEIVEGTGLKALKGAGRVSGAELEDGRVLDVDFVIAGVGVDPATGLAVAAGIETDNGIKVDAFGRTSFPDVWAAGDCASFPFNGARIRLESVPNAIDQAEAVAANMLGAETPCEAEPWFWSDQYDVKLQIAGLNTGYDSVVTRDRVAAQSFWYYRGDTLLAIDAMRDPRSYMIAKRLISNGVSPDRALVADPDADLGALLPRP